MAEITWEGPALTTTRTRIAFDDVVDAAYRDVLAQPDVPDALLSLAGLNSYTREGVMALVRGHRPVPPEVYEKRYLEDD